MTTQILNKKTKELEKEVRLLRSFMVGYLGKDSEGEYRPEFVKDILSLCANDEVEHKFENSKKLLSYLKVNDKN